MRSDQNRKKRKISILWLRFDDIPDNRRLAQLYKTDKNEIPEKFVLNRKGIFWEMPKLSESGQSQQSAYSREPEPALPMIQFLTTELPPTPHQPDAEADNWPA